ncbi:cysteine-rich with EGF-like domain protein 2 isoform X2 [Leptidea sinapis]|uniref:cysteine-rich with EGF-like domain protein 2 isoform X2 n=1 Tax=Leptidea sinapis TaxID=189913 RepID=UPI00213E2897|nr:cysteine-rich with EGF-like domain protein 2 isoform X2 [Leptidea sinapis]
MLKFKLVLKFLFFNVILFANVYCSSQPQALNPSILTQSKSLGECYSCKLFVESFKKGLERTSRGKFEGGDAAWEEEKLKKSYKRSEIRLVDIQEGICRENTKHSVHCHNIAEKAEEFIEEWWAQDPDESEDLYAYICIDKLKLCCPIHHYGKECIPCPGDHNNICNGNGKCRGDGTRKGNGTCLCDPAYYGDTCDQCATGYYLSYKDDNKMLCSQCHKSCMGGCRGGTARDCVTCKHGYIFEDGECKDVNECQTENICKENEFCANSLGSYACFKCDRACVGCHGDGADMCIKCAEGYVKEDEFCVNEKKKDNQFETLTKARNEEL